MHWFIHINILILVAFIITFQILYPVTFFRCKSYLANSWEFQTNTLFNKEEEDSSCGLNEKYSSKYLQDDQETRACKWLDNNNHWKIVTTKMIPIWLISQKIVKSICFTSQTFNSKKKKVEYDIINCIFMTKFIYCTRCGRNNPIHISYIMVRH